MDGLDCNLTNIIVCCQLQYQHTIQGVIWEELSCEKCGGQQQFTTDHEGAQGLVAKSNDIKKQIS